MTDGIPPEDPGSQTGTGDTGRKQRDPAATLTSAMVVYIFVNLTFALPLVIFPAAYFDFIGLDADAADQLGGLRWVGAVLLAWSIIAIQVLARPGGKAVFVTAGAFQLTFGAVAFLYSWSIREYGWDLWYQVVASLVWIGGAVYLWWARMSGRKVLRGNPPP
ncbi:MAG: hypothetical protein QNJ77_12215 [Acidimicrobiia bacterium]|nr:hypothetical protein [Acidimicrobiia bacterium]